MCLGVRKTCFLVFKTRVRVSIDPLRAFKTFKHVQDAFPDSQDAFVRVQDAFPHGSRRCSDMKTRFYMSTRAHAGRVQREQ
eukprot:215799-Lingulodinium_polyedra.AAC.1